MFVERRYESTQGHAISCHVDNSSTLLLHVLTIPRLGGGDQIYNDGIRVGGPLREWTDIPIPKKRRNYPFNEDLRKKCDE